MSRQLGRTGDQPVRHARGHGGAQRIILATCAVAVVFMAALLGGLVPGVVAAPQLGVDVASSALGVADGLRDSDEVSRSTDRDGVPVVATELPAAAASDDLPTWTGAPPGSAGGAATPRGAGGGAPTVTSSGSATQPSAEPTSVTSTPTTAVTDPTASSSTEPTSSSTSPGALGDLEQRLVDLTNVERVAAGCAAVAVDTRLVSSAEAHAVDMVAKQYFDHTGLDGSTPTSRGALVGYPAGVAENIATGFADPEAVITAWMASPEHKANIVDCTFVSIGIGFDPGALPGYGGGTWVQTFGAV